MTTPRRHRPGRGLLLCLPPPLSAQMTPRRYTAFGLRIDSDLELLEFDEISEPDAFLPGPADVVVRVGTPPAGGDGQDRASAIADGVLQARVDRGSEIVVDPADGVDPGFLSAVITGELFSVVLRQRGSLVLHGSGVARDGRAVGFIGDSGWGKSTLAATLIKRGWRLLTDDLLVVGGLSSDVRQRGETDGSRSRESREDQAPVAVPSHGSMRLSEEAASATASASRSAGQAHGLTTKVRVDRSDAFDARPTPLRSLFVLDPRFADAHQAIPLSARDATAQFIAHTRAQKLLRAPAAKLTHLARCADLSRRVPTFALRRRYGLGEIESLCDVVEDALHASLGAGERSGLQTSDG